MPNARELIEQVAQGARPQDVTEGLIEVGGFSIQARGTDMEKIKDHLDAAGVNYTASGGNRIDVKGSKDSPAAQKALAAINKDKLDIHFQEHGYMGFEGRNVEGRVLPSIPSGMMAMRGLGESVAQLDPKDYPGLQKANLAKLEAAHKVLMDAYQGARRYLADLDDYQKHGGGDTFNLVGAHTKLGREVIENGGKAADAIVKVVHALRALELG